MNVTNNEVIIAAGVVDVMVDAGAVDAGVGDAGVGDAGSLS